MEAEPARQLGERPSKRRCFWEYRRARESATKKKLGGDVHWSLSWSSSTLPSTLYRREGENTALLRDASECYLMLIVSYKKLINKKVRKVTRLLSETGCFSGEDIFGVPMT